ncbi:MAG TPA: hypothetical protein VKU90_10265 [Caulobacteraceae bacterium]|nr:hypothetical protein [Caulobacteraceae bacterium]
MISIEDCIALSGLTREEVDAIGEHEHIPEAVAASVARSIMRTEAGPQEVRDMIVDDIRACAGGGHLRHAAELLKALRHFMAEHPEAGAGFA